MARQKLSVSHSTPRRKPWRAYAAVAVSAIILAPIAGAGIFLARFNPNAYAPQIIAAIQKATGRNLSIGGPIHLQLSWTPTLAASDLTLSNPSGFNDPALLTLKQVQARIALLPLLHHQLDILDLKLVAPKLYLERTAAGQADWILQPTPAINTTANNALAKPGTRQPYTVALESVSLENGQIILRSQGAAQPTVINLTSLTGKAPSLSAALHLSGSAAIGTAPLTLQGIVGPVSGLTSATSAPWPVDLTFGFAGAVATLQGQIAQPRAMRGYNLQFTAQIPALEAVGTALPPAWLHGMQLPALHNVMASLTLHDQAGESSALSNIVLTAGDSDLSSLWPGLHLVSLTASLPNMDGAGTASLRGNISQLPLLAQAQWTGMSSFFAAPLSPQNTLANSFSGSLNVSLGSASANLSGGLATPQTLSGAAWSLAMTIPDLSALSPAWGAPLPAWKNIAVKTTLTDSGGQGLSRAIALSGLTVSTDNANFGGQARLTLGARPALTLNLTIPNANFDALRAAMPEATTAGAPTQIAAQSGLTAPPSLLPLNLMRRADADITINADHLVYDQTNYTALQTHAVLKNGLLTVAPFTVQLPGGSVSASGSLDATVEPATETLRLNAPALALGPLLQTFNLPDAAQGTAHVQMNATAHGDTLPAMLGSVSGQFGFASVNGEIDGQVIAQIIGRALQSVGLPTSLMGTPGMVPLRCAALRLDAEDGSGTVRALTFDSSRLLLEGEGTVNFATQTLALVLKPYLRTNGSNIIVPIKVGGTFTSPQYSVAPATTLLAAGQAAAGLYSPGGASLLDKVANALTGGNRSADSNSNSNDACLAALQLARMGQAGPAPRAANTDTPTPTQPVGSPRSLLNALLNQ